jgi:hypothetical protein
MRLSRPYLAEYSIKGVDGEHYFLLEPIGGEPNQANAGRKVGGTLFATEPGFKAMNTVLKLRAEQNSTQNNAPTSKH